MDVLFSEGKMRRGRRVLEGVSNVTENFFNAHSAFEAPPTPTSPAGEGGTCLLRKVPNPFAT